MTTISIEDARLQLGKLIESLSPGEEVIITSNNQPIARLTPTNGSPTQLSRTPGAMRGTVVSMASDFDAPLEDFGDYMQ